MCLEFDGQHAPLHTSARCGNPPFGAQEWNQSSCRFAQSRSSLRPARWGVGSQGSRGSRHCGVAFKPGLHRRWGVWGGGDRPLMGLTCAPPRLPSPFQVLLPLVIAPALIRNEAQVKFCETSPNYFQLFFFAFCMHR